MNDEIGLLRQIDEHPEDRESLLIYADWLEDHGQSDRTEFIRLQDELQKMKHGQWGMKKRYRRLLQLGKSFPEDWLAIVSRPRLTGTTWTGPHSPSGDYVFRFRPAGVLNYTSNTGTFENGTWKQIGPQVVMQMNDHYADYEGLVLGDRIKGTASNITGMDWPWDVRLTLDPDLCDPGEPITTVYPHEYQGRGRRRRRRRRSSE